MNMRCPQCGADLGVPRSAVHPGEREWCPGCRPPSAAASEPDLPATVPVEVGRDWWDDAPARVVGRVVADTANHAWVEVDPWPGCPHPPMAVLGYVAQARFGRSAVREAAADPTGRTRLWLVAGRVEPAPATPDIRSPREKIR
jgi:hypothetical protein